MLIVQKPSGIQSPSNKMKIILLITMETLIKTEECNCSRSAWNNGVSWRTIQHKLLMHRVTSGSEMLFCDCLGYLWVIDQSLEELCQIHFDACWCLYSGLSVGQRHIKGKVAVCSHAHTHWSAVLSLSPCCPRCLSILQTRQKNSLLSVLQRSEWGVEWVGSELVTVLRSALCVLRESH